LTWGPASAGGRGAAAGDAAGSPPFAASVEGPGGIAAAPMPPAGRGVGCRENNSTEPPHTGQRSQRSARSGRRSAAGFHRCPRLQIWTCGMATHVVLGTGWLSLRQAKTDETMPPNDEAHLPRRLRELEP